MRIMVLVLALAMLTLAHAGVSAEPPLMPLAKPALQDKDSKDAPEQDGDVPPDEPGSPLKAKEPLLPVRPKDFNPMLQPMPLSIDGGGSMGIQQLATDNIMVAELKGYTLQLTLFTRWLTLVASGVGLLLVAGILFLRTNAVQARRLANAVDAGVELMEARCGQVGEHSQKGMRAYVYTNGAKGEMPTDKSGKYNVRVEVKNFGSTPAYALSGWMTVFVGDMMYEKNINLLPQESEIVETVLPPGGVCFYYAQTHEPIAPEIKAIAGSVRAIYTYGEIRYKDIFGNERYSRFRIKCSGSTNLAKGTFDHCAAGNEAS